MSASPAKAFIAQNAAANQIKPRKNDLFLPIRDAQLAGATFDFPAFSVENGEAGRILTLSRNATFSGSNVTNHAAAA
jgi:hypothetical protein